MLLVSGGVSKGLRPFLDRVSPASGTSIKFLGIPCCLESPARSGNRSGRRVGRGGKGREGVLATDEVVLSEHWPGRDSSCPRAPCRAQRPRQGEHRQDSCVSAPSLRPSTAPGRRKSHQLFRLFVFCPRSRPTLALTHAPAQAAVLPPPPSLSQPSSLQYTLNSPTHANTCTHTHTRPIVSSAALPSPLVAR